MSNESNPKRIKVGVPFSYQKKSKFSSDIKEGRLINQEAKAQKRKWREEHLMSKLESQKKREKAEEEKKNEAKQEEERKVARGRPYTVSIAVPGSIMDNAQSLPLRAYLGGQIARAAAIFNVDEIVVFNEDLKTESDQSEFKGLLSRGRGNTQLLHILQYLECPQYLRKEFFPFHRDLAQAGVLNPLDMPHHLRETDWCEYREGVTLRKPTKDKTASSYANIGLRKDVLLDMGIPPGKRVTVKMDETSQGAKCFRGQAVSPSEPRESHGLYWGYTARLASSLSDVFDKCPYDDGYDLLIGTSDKGTDANTVTLPSYKHALVVFGGLKGLELSLETDAKLTSNDPRDLFHEYLNVCPQQGSRTIRTEEAVLIAMATLAPKLTAANKSTS